MLPLGIGESITLHDNKKEILFKKLEISVSFKQKLDTLASKDASSSGHLVLPHLGLPFVLMLRPFIDELVMFLDFELRTSLCTSILLS